MAGEQRKLPGILAAIGMLILILDSNLALQGARSGLELCIKTVIPSLFPFFVLSTVLSSALSENCSGLTRQIAGLLGIPPSATPLLIPAFLGGYPVGAKCVGDLFQRKQLTKTEAERLLAFSSNAGPSFLFGVVSVFFPDKKLVWFLWLLQIISAVLVAASFSGPVGTNIPTEPLTQPEPKEVILSAAKAMALVCCWVILFRIVIFFLTRWFFWRLPVWMQVLVMGFLELTNGCCQLLQIADIRLRFVLCAVMLSFGGVCVLLQTASVTKGLSLRYYICGKLLQTVFCFLLSCAIAAEDGLIFLALVPLLIVILRKIQNKYSNPRSVPV